MPKQRTLQVIDPRSVFCPEGANATEGGRAAHRTPVVAADAEDGAACADEAALAARGAAALPALVPRVAGLSVERVAALDGAHGLRDVGLAEGHGAEGDQFAHDLSILFVVAVQINK